MAFKHTAETKQKLSDMRKGERNPFFGRKHTPEFKARLAERTRINNSTRQYEIAERRVPDLHPPCAAYLAGVIDGEGSITLPRGRKGVAIVIANTYEPLMTWLVVTVGGNYGRNTHPTRIEREPCYNWRLYGARDVYAIIQMVRPYLIIKAARADEAIDILQRKYGRRL